MSNKKSRPMRDTLVFLALIFAMIKGPALLDAARGAPEYDADMAGPVTVFTTAWCGYCKKTKHFLNTHDIPFTERDIEASEAAFAKYNRLGGNGVPVVLVGEQVVHGYDLGKLRAALECRTCES